METPGPPGPGSINIHSLEVTYQNHPNQPTECIGNFSQFIGDILWCSDFYLCSKATSKPETELG